MIPPTRTPKRRQTSVRPSNSRPSLINETEKESSGPAGG